MLKIKDMNSLLDIVKSLILNDYTVDIKTIYQEFPREKYIDYFEVNYVKDKR